MNISHPNYQTGGARPRNFQHSHYCAHNQQAQLIPENARCNYKDVHHFNPSTSSKKKVEIRREPMSPSTVKHLYSDNPLNYEQRFKLTPKGTLYDHQFIETHPTGLGRRKVLGGGHYKVYPLTNRHVIESREYTSHSFPKPIWGTEKNKDLVTYANHVRTQ